MGCSDRGEGEDWKGHRKALTPEELERIGENLRSQYRSAAAFARVSIAADAATSAFHRLAEAMAPIEAVERLFAEAASTTELARIFGVPIEWLDDVLRVSAATGESEWLVDPTPRGD